MKLYISYIFVPIILNLIIFQNSYAQGQKKTKYKPVIAGKWWQVAGNPNLGKYTTSGQQPVDFGIWQAADSTWQIWSCIRGTSVGEHSRLFYCWQGKKITDTAWEPIGIAMKADTNFGETQGGLQAPFVMKAGKRYNMFYGDWKNICLATGMDGKTFARQLDSNNNSGMFTEGIGSNTRDPMTIRVGKVYYTYYSAFPNNHDAVYLRKSKNLKSWSPSKMVAFGGSAGSGKYAAECPFVYFDKASGYYYLFRTQQYGKNAHTNVYCSKDPEDFGVNDDSHLVTTLPVAAPEIVKYKDQIYIAALLPSLKGIRIAKLNFVPIK